MANFNVRYLKNRYLSSLAGGQKKPSQQKEMATDLSKFLKFASSDLDLSSLVKMKEIEKFVEELQDRRIGPSGITSKLNTLCSAQRFLIHR